MIIGKQIALYRKENKLSQKEMADYLHVTRQAVSNWERGKTEPDAQMIKAIAEYLDVEINCLFYSDASLNRKRMKAVNILFIVRL